MSVEEAIGFARRCLPTLGQLLGRTGRGDSHFRGSDTQVIPFSADEKEIKALKDSSLTERTQGDGRKQPSWKESIL